MTRILNSSKKSIALFSLCVVLSCFVSASIPLHAALVAYYPLGENNSAGPNAPNGAPQDVVGAYSFTQSLGAGSVIFTDHAPVGGSTACLATGPATGMGMFWGADYSTMPTDNFKIDLWVKVPAASRIQTADIFETADNANGTLKISLSGGYWAASSHNQFWLADPTAAQRVAVAPDAWTELTISRVGGVTSFYVNGIQDGVSATAPPVWNSVGYLDATPGGGTWFTGRTDELKIFNLANNTRTWNGSANSEWANAANWNGSILPNDTTDAVIPGNTGNTPEITTPVTVNSLSLGVTGPTGTMQTTGGSLIVKSAFLVGDTDSGTFLQYTGATTVGSNLVVGNRNGGTSIYVLFNDGTVTSGADLCVGNEGLGSFDQNGGAVAVAGLLTLGNRGTGNGTYTVNSGSLTIGGELRVGQEGVGSFAQHAGTVTVASPIGAVAGVYLGNSAASSTTSSGNVVLSGGTFTASGPFVVGTRANGSLTVNQNGQLLNGVNSNLAISGGFDLGVPLTSHITLADNGVITAASLTIASGALTSGTFTQSGGTLNVGVLDAGNGAATHAWTGGTLNAQTVNHMNLVNQGGTLNPGGVGAIGTTTVSNGGYSQNAASTLAIDLAPTFNQNDILHVPSGTIALGGKLVVTKAAGQGFHEGQVFQFLQGNIANTFNLLSLPVLPSFLSWDAGGLYSIGTLSVVKTGSYVTGSAAWILPGSGTWYDTASWSPGVIPNGIDQTAMFHGGLTSNAVVGVDGPKTVGAIDFDNSTYSYTLQGIDTISLQTSTGTPTIHVASGSHAISASLLEAQGLIVSSNGTLTLAGILTGAGNFVKTGAGTVSITGQALYTGNTLVEDGTLNVDALTASPIIQVTGSGTTLNATRIVADTLTIGATAAAVPEPSTTVLSLIASLLTVLVWKRKTRNSLRSFNSDSMVTFR